MKKSTITALFILIFFFNGCSCLDIFSPWSNDDIDEKNKELRLEVEKLTIENKELILELEKWNKSGFASMYK